MRFSTSALLFMVFLTGVQGGTPATPLAKEPSPAVIKSAPSPWEIIVSPYGWMAGIDGSVAAHGYTASTSIGIDQILKNLDMVAMMNIEARKGRFGGWVDGIYLKMSAGGDTPGPLLDSLGISMDSLIAEGALFYRVWESEKGYLDLYGGARYVRMGTDLSLDVSDAGVRDVSEQLSAQVFETLGEALRGKAAPALSSSKSKVSAKASQAASKAHQALANALTQKAQEVRSTINDLRAIAAAHPRLVEVIRNSDRLRQVIRSVAESKATESLAELEAKAATAEAKTQAAIAEVKQTVARAKARARRAVERAEKQLAKEIERTLRDAIPDEISQSGDWIDPFVGFRSRYNFTDRFYAVAKADIGGFGVGSDLAWQAYGALGWQFTKKVSTEIGYRYMDIDYSGSNGLAYDLTMSGAQIALCVRF